MIQIHPKHAFINTDVVISNKGQESVIIEDLLTNESFSLSSGEYRTSRFIAGEHRVRIKSISGTIEEQTFVIEDAFKFGGSESKRTYVFDSNPWAIIVMRDRTYFLNENTKEQFVEHNLSPDLIEEISPDYLLFTSEQDCSFFSLLTMSFEKTLSSSTCVYYGNGYCVLSYSDGVSYSGGLYLYRLNPFIKGERLIKIICDEYVIDKERAVIYASNKAINNKILAIRLLNIPENDYYEQSSEVEIDGKFVCFLGCHSLLYTRSNQNNEDPNMLFCKDLSQGGSTSLIYNGEQPISSVNGIKVWDSSSYDKIWQEYLTNRIYSGDGIRLKIEVAENLNRICHIQTMEYVTIRGHLKEEKVVSSLYSEGTHLITDKKRLVFKRRSNYVYVSCENVTYVFYNNTYKAVCGVVLFTNYDDPYTKSVIKGRMKYHTIDGTEISEYDPGKSKPSYGLFSCSDDTGAFIYWIKDNGKYPGERIDDNNGDIVVSGGNTITPRYFLKNGEVIPVPASTEYIVAYSSTRRTFLLKRGGYYSFARKVGKSWHYSVNLVLSIYDTLKVTDAVFCSDGDNFIFQKENEMVLFDFKNSEETSFPSNSCIEFNINGYRPYCVKDYYARPVIVDPLSHRTVDHNFLRQYRFSSVDGKVFFEGRKNKHFLIKDDSEVSDSEYQALRDRYDYMPNSTLETRDVARQSRIHYCNNVLDKTLGNNAAELSLDKFVDSFIVNTVEFALIRKNGCLIEIRVGEPLYYMNYVAFSPDSARVAICGKYKDASGLCLVYDLEKDEVIHRSTSPEFNGVGKTKAIWLGLFSKNGVVAYYDSNPNTYIVRSGDKPITISGRSFLTFSPSGKYLALSRQGYTPYESDGLFWGHEPSCDVYIAKTEDPQKCLCHYNNHGSRIMGLSVMRETIASVSFSVDDKRILSVSNDGVVVVRNLHLGDMDDYIEVDNPF